MYLVNIDCVNEENDPLDAVGHLATITIAPRDERSCVIRVATDDGYCDCVGDLDGAENVLDIIAAALRAVTQDDGIEN